MSLLSAFLPQQPRSSKLVAFGLLSLVLGFSLLLFKGTESLTNPIWFIGMLVIFGAALAFIAITFSGLGLASPNEAFALPSGSVRTLLAVGVMVLFAVFGLASVSNPSEQPFASANFKGEATALADEIKRYEAKGLLVIPEELSNNGTKLNLYHVKSTKDQAVTDLEKQILTALITLLTAVVSFYFGSRSAEGAKDSKGQNEVGGLKLPEFLAGDILTLDGSLSEAVKRLDRLLPAKAAGASDIEFAKKLEQCKTDLQSAKQVRLQIDISAKDFITGQGTAEVLASSIAGLKSKLKSLNMLLSEVEALVAK